MKTTVLTKRQQNALAEVVENWARKNRVLGESQRIVVEARIENVPKAKVSIATGEKPSGEELHRLLSSMRVGDLGLSVRPFHRLNNDNIWTLGELVRMSEAQLLKCRNFGKKSFNEIKAVLAGLGLSLGMAEPIGSFERRTLEEAPLGKYLSYKWFETEQFLAKHGVKTVREFLHLYSIGIGHLDCEPGQLGLYLPQRKADEIRAILKQAGF